MVGFTPIEDGKNKLVVNAKKKILHTFIKKPKKKAKPSPTPFDKELFPIFGYQFLDKAVLLSLGHIDNNEMQRFLNT